MSKSCDVCGTEMVQPFFKWYCPNEDNHRQQEDAPVAADAVVMERTIGARGGAKWVYDGKHLRATIAEVTTLGPANYVATLMVTNPVDTSGRPIDLSPFMMGSDPSEAIEYLNIALNTAHLKLGDFLAEEPRRLTLPKE